jgi:hypothetical protein
VAVDWEGNPWIVDKSNQVYRWDNSRFVEYEGIAATDIAIGNGQMWIITAHKSGSNYRIARVDLKTGKLHVVGGAATQIAVDANGRPWVVNSAGYVYRWNGKGWSYKAGIKARSIAAGAEGSIYLVSTSYYLYKFNEATNKYDRVQSSLRAREVAVDRYGLPYVTYYSNRYVYITVNDCLKLKYPKDKTMEELKPKQDKHVDISPPCKQNYYELMTGAAIDITIADGGRPWVIGTNQGIYRWVEAKFAWERVSGAAVRIGGGPNDKPWVVNSAGYVYEWLGTSWKYVPGLLAIDIDVNKNGDVWAVGKGDHGVYRYIRQTGTWSKVSPTTKAYRIAVDTDGDPWILSTSLYTYRWENNKFVYIRGRAYDIAVGSKDQAVCIGTNRVPYKWSYARNRWEA